MLSRQAPRCLRVAQKVTHPPMAAVQHLGSNHQRRRLATTCAASLQHGSDAPSSATAAGVDEQQQRQERELLRQWTQQSSIYYSHYALHRAAEARKDEAQLSAWFNAPTARVTPVSGAKVLLVPAAAADAAPGVATTPSPSGDADSTINASSTGAKLAPVWVSPAADLAAALSPDSPPLFLGLDDQGVPHFAAPVADAAAADGLAASHHARWHVARTAGPDMAPGDAAVMAVASGLAQWNADARFHGATGAPTQPQAGGFARRCSSSGRVVYPRIDPAIITLVTAGPDWCLLGRKAGWPAGRYSTLAGFLELGETLEQALCREVWEESGVAADLHSVRYVASQPWPFPRSLMVGFYAEAASTAGAAGGAEGLSHEGRMAMMDTGISAAELADALQGVQLQLPRAQEDEMEDVRWFHRDWLQAALEQGEAAAAPGGFFIPGPYSLAHRLITGWLGTHSSSTTSSTSSSSSSNGSSNGTGAGSNSNSWIGDSVPQVEVDVGVFKYVLLRLTDRADASRSKLLVRGSCGAAYHNHILQHTKARVAALSGGQLDVQVLGGGRIEHHPEQHVLSVYGYSAAFGPAVHEATAGLLRRWHPFCDVTWSYEGY